MIHNRDNLFCSLRMLRPLSSAVYWLFSRAMISWGRKGFENFGKQKEIFFVMKWECCFTSTRVEYRE